MHEHTAPLSPRVRQAIADWLVGATVRIMLRRVQAWPIPVDTDSDAPECFEGVLGLSDPTPDDRAYARLVGPQFPTGCSLDQALEIGTRWGQSMGWLGTLPDGRKRLVAWWLGWLYEQPGWLETHDGQVWKAISVDGPLAMIPGEQSVPDEIADLPDNRRVRGQDRMPPGLAALNFTVDIGMFAQIRYDPEPDWLALRTEADLNAREYLQTWRVRFFPANPSPRPSPGPGPSPRPRRPRPLAA
jgi:hypothetical protein